MRISDWGSDVCSSDLSKRDRVMIVYGSVVSPFVRKLLGYLGEKGIDFELKGVGIGDPDPGFQAASPLGKMPAMDDDGFLLADSSAIIHYLEAKHPEPPLIPADPQIGRASCRERVCQYV